jgi:AraC-like DNA-binding protein
MIDRITKRDKQRLQLGREELVERISGAVQTDGTLEVAPGFRVSRVSKPTQSVNTVYQPAFCFIAQGSKIAQLGDEIYRYDPETYMIYTVDLPLIFRVDEASTQNPYLGFRLDLEPAVVASVLAESDLKITKGDAAAKAVGVNAVGRDLLDTVVRLVRLIDNPNERKVLFPLVAREIVFRLLAGGQGPRLAHLLTTGETRRISKAIGHLREHFAETIKIENIARDLGMSVSGFHHHFKSVTAMTPLQYQKQIRMQEARRLMLAQDMDAASAGFRVGYEDPSYFSRDYKKQFGAPPQRDIAKLRQTLEM